MIFEARDSFYLGRSPVAVKSMFWFSLLANEIAGNFISSSGYGPDCLRWLNTVFDTSVLFTLSSKTLDPLVAKNGSKQINNTKVLIIKLTYVPLPW